MVRKKTPSVACPTCGKQSPFTPENPFRPFCSERCKLIDLGQWATENYRIPDTTMPLDDEQTST